MEWWQPVSMAGTVIVTLTTVLTLWWRVLERTRLENRIAHDKIGDSIAKLRDDLTRDIGEVRGDLHGEIVVLRDEIVGVRGDLDGKIGGLRDDLTRDIRSLGDRLGAEIATNRQGLVAVGEGLAELRGELRGVNRSLQDLREDFRTHVYEGNATAQG